MAKQILAKYNIPKENIEIMEIDSDSDSEEIQNYMRILTGHGSVPRVFIGAKCIGGGNETSTLHRSGQLATLLQNAGALSG